MYKIKYSVFKEEVTIWRARKVEYIWTSYTTGDYCEIPGKILWKHKTNDYKIISVEKIDGDVI